MAHLESKLVYLATGSADKFYFPSNSLPCYLGKFYSLFLEYLFSICSTRKLVNNMESKNRSIVFAFIATYISSSSRHIALSGWAMSKKEAGDELGFTKTTFGAISTIYLLCYSIGNFLGGYLVTKYSPKRVVSICSFILAGFYVLITIVSSTLPYEGIFYGMFVFIGILHGPIWIGSVTIAGNWFPKKLRGGVMGAWITAANVGKLLGSFLSAFVIDVLHSDWQVLLLFVAVILVISGF